MSYAQMGGYNLKTYFSHTLTLPTRWVYFFVETHTMRLYSSLKPKNQTVASGFIPDVCILGSSFLYGLDSSNLSQFWV